MEEKGIIHVESLSEEDVLTNPATPKDLRDNVVYELVSTERKYVQDLESLQNYMREVSSQEILSQDTMHYLFGNLNALVDFQRRFLIQIEDQAAHPSKEQRFGHLFIQFEDAFQVYEPFCANFQIAQDLVLQEAHKLQKLSNIMSPTYELPAMLIKPIQRVCKYPLLLQQLIKATPDDWPFAEENKVGLDAIQRVTKKVNETKRLQENQLVVQDLRKRIVDDNNNNHHAQIIVDSAGPLLLHDKFTMQKHNDLSDQNSVREMTVFLFEKIIIICKEIKDVNKNAISIKKKRKEGSMVIRCKILLSKLELAKGTSSQNGHYTLHISWMESESQTILLRCRNDEQLRQWLNVIIDIKESTAATKVDLVSAPQTPRMDTNNPLLSFDEDEDNHNTNNNEEADDIPSENVNAHNPTMMTRNRSYSYQHYAQHHYHHHHQHHAHQPLTPTAHRYPSEITSRKASLSNHSTARHYLSSGGGISSSNSNSSSTSHQYHPHHLPPPPPTPQPPLPRSPTASTTNINQVAAGSMNTSNERLNSPSTLSFPASPPTSYPPSPTATVRTSSTSTSTVNSTSVKDPSNANNNGILPSGSLWQRRQQHHRSNEILDQQQQQQQTCSNRKKISSSSSTTFASSSTSTNTHSPTTTTPTTSSPTKYHHFRARSQSTPNIARPSYTQESTTAPEVPTLSSYQRTASYSQQQQQQQQQQDHHTMPTTAPATPAPSILNNSNNQSQSSLLLQQQDTTKVKVHYYGAIYVVVVPTNIELEELTRKIESKIKLSSPLSATSPADDNFDNKPTNIGLKYEDEDGDLITISSNEDVQMGFENKGPNNAVNLFVT
ncbi:hypothetical protein BDF20DRAFT_863738 [Mycotypha africana]|uniref:uncharacterized protein n=1 Tax=Mycotypha africana TaxID=64632 RepID=UPI002301B648|nr:uncharacterized protein BDF20DRAFT_863738 [Mycotypha africana]KAI8981878.1 hypothetical protein BDF20DRAFT_863738 [Mycotypha africana]